MKIMADELERREKQREAMFAGLRARQDANIAAQSGVFEARAREEQALADRIAKAQELTDAKTAATLAAKEAMREQFRRELHETVDWQLAEKAEARRLEREEARAMQREAMAVKEAVEREARERRDAQHVAREEMRVALEAQVLERIKANTAGMSVEEQRNNKAALSRLHAAESM
jgi:hypothetical protein